MTYSIYQYARITENEIEWKKNGKIEKTVTVKFQEYQQREVRINAFNTRTELANHDAPETDDLSLRWDLGNIIP